MPCPACWPQPLLAKTRSCPIRAPVGQASACQLSRPSLHQLALVGRTPWSARDALVPLSAQRISSLAPWRRHSCLPCRGPAPQPPPPPPPATPPPPPPQADPSSCSP